MPATRDVSKTRYPAPRVRPLIVAILLVVARLAAAGQSAGSTKTGSHFKVVCDFDDDAIAAAALETAEASWTVSAALYGGDAKPLENPLVIRLYRTVEAFEKVEDEQTHGRFKAQLAFSSFGTKTSYIVLQPPGQPDDVLRAIGLPTLTRHLVAHEASHLACHRMVRIHETLPEWIAEGAAERVAEETLQAHGWIRSAASDPFFSTKMLQASKLAQAGSLRATDIVRDKIEGETGQRYAVEWLLFRLLVTGSRKAAFRAALAKVWALPTEAHPAERIEHLVLQAFGLKEPSGLDGDLKAYAKAQTPEWQEVFRSLDTSQPRWFQIAFASANAIAWNQTPPPKPPYRLTGSLEILESGEKQMNVLLGKNDDGFVTVAFLNGGVTVLEFGAKSDAWNALANEKSPAVATGRKIGFAVTVDGGTVGVEVDGTKVLEARVGARPMNGLWGLGVQSASAGLWSDVRCASRKENR